ncbi:MAG: T9SS type A sorting domain-containing protein [bacterium]
MIRSWSKLIVLVALACFCLAPALLAGDGTTAGSDTGPNSYPDGGPGLSLTYTGKSVGDTITVSGHGFSAWETVEIRLQRYEATERGGEEYDRWNISAQSDGVISSQWVVSSAAYAGQPMIFTAFGYESGIQVSATTIEVDSRVTIVARPDTVVAGEPFTVTALLEENCCDGLFAPMPGRDVAFYAHLEGCGVDLTQAPLAVVTTDENGLASATLTLDDVEYFTIAVKYSGEAAPGDQGQPNSACDPEARVSILAAIDCTHTQVIPLPPEIACVSDNLSAVCQGSAHCFSSTILEYGYGQLTFSIPAGLPATIDQGTGEVCLTMDTSGYYAIEITATDELGRSAVCAATFDVEVNSAPEIWALADTALFLCAPQQVCIPVQVTDVDGNQTSVTSSHGTYANGHVCFVPYAGGVYEIEITAYDDCGASASTVSTVTIMTDQDISITCPNDTTVFACDVDTFCFPIEGIPEGAGVAVTGLHTWWNADDQTVCFYSACSYTNTIGVQVTTPCGTHSCSFRVHVDCNEAPLVILPPDTTYWICDVTEICVPVGISDADGNLASIAVEGGQYNAAYGTVCFTAYGSGTHTVTVTATDECGDVTTDQIVIITHVGEDPVCELPSGYEYDLQLCAAEPIMIPVTVSDPTATCSVYSGPGEIANGYWVYTPSASGAFDVTIRCYNICGNYCEKTFWVNIELDSEPVVSCPTEQQIQVCDLGSICVEGFSVSDVGGYLRVVATVNGSSFDVFESDNSSGGWSGSVCFVPVAGPNDIALTAFDACGHQVSCQTEVTVRLNAGPTCEGPNDTTLYLCGAGEVCLPIEVYDPDGGITDLQVISGPGSITDGAWCYPAQTSGAFGVTVQATDDCGVSCTQTFVVTLEVNQPPTANCPVGFELFVCDLSEEICLDGFTATDADGNLAVTTINGVPFPGGTYCFAPQIGTNTFTLIAADECGLADTCTTEIYIGYNREPVCDGPTDTTIILCAPETVCLPLSVDDPDGNFSRWEVTSGGGEIIDGQWCFTPAGSRVENVTVRAVDSCWAWCEHSFTVNFTVNRLPEITDRYTSAHLCDYGTLREVGVLAYDPDDDPLTFDLLSGEGSISPSGLISYTPTAAGVYVFEVAAYDTCGGDTGYVYDTITFNNPPELTAYDSTYRLCALEEICFDVVGSDPDGDALDIYQQEGPGVFTQLTDSSGRTCFMPQNVDSATYVFTYCVVDPCMYAKDGVEPPACPPCDPDTIRITIILDRPPTIECPGPQVFSTCEPDTFCFVVTGFDPDGGPLSYAVLSGNAEIVGNQVCVFAEGSTSFDVMVAVTDLCGQADTCTVPVTIEGNHGPTVDLAADFTANLCEPGEICFDAVVDDADGDQLTVVSSFGNYDAAADRICFWADTAGVYAVSVTATDECGAEATATIYVTVAFGGVPTVDLGDDFSTASCEALPVCVDANISGGYTSVVASLGTYNSQTGQVCFTPDGAGQYMLIVDVFSECGNSSDTVVIDVELNDPPFVSQLADTSVFLCFPTEICWPVEVSDVNGNIESIEVSHGTYADGELCFTPYDSGTYEIMITVTDSCGVVARSAAILTVQTDQGIQIVCPDDTTFFACDADTFCVPLQGVPEGAVVEVTGFHTWYDDQARTICVWSECGISETVGVSVTTACGTHRCSFVVTILCNHDPLVVLPPDTSFALCEWQDICVPVGISDQDGNLMDIQIDGYPYLYYDTAAGTVCFWGDMTGDYEIIVRAEDSCGAIGADTMIVHLWANTPPHISFCCDTVITTCEAEVCVPIDVFDGDGDETITDIYTDYGYYNWDTGEICFIADSSGHYCIEVVAVDTCGAVDTLLACVSVVVTDYVYIDCPTGVIQTLPMCGPDSVCVPLEIVGENYSVITDHGVWADGQLCFWADTTAIFAVQVYLDGPCNDDSCEVLVAVEISDTNLVSCPGDQSVTLCEADTICYDYIVSPSVTEVQVSGGYLAGGQVCVPILQPGEHTARLIAFSPCGADTCDFTVTADFNSGPTVLLGNDTTIVGCDPYQICLPFSITDAEDNIVQIITSEGAVIIDDEICFTPPGAGTYAVYITALDACGLADTDSLWLTFESGGTPWLSCPPQTIVVAQCEPDSICVPVLIQPSDAIVEILPAGSWNPGRQEVCIWVDQTQLYEITVKATAACGTDSCSFTIDAHLDETPSVTCVGQIDTLVCFEQPVTICYPVTITGAGATVTVDPIGTYNAGEVCVPIDTAGTYVIEVVADAPCGADTCYTTINVAGDELPTLYLPTEQLTFERCPDDSDIICIDGIFATDAEGIQSLTMTCGPGSFTFATNDSGYVCLPADIAIGTYEFCFEAFDGCHLVGGSFMVDIIAKEDCDVCLTVRIEGGVCVPVGGIKHVDLIMESDTYLGGFDVLISFDASVLSFVDATIEGTEIDGWEYFDYRVNQAGCGGNCPSGLIRFVGIADINNGPAHPPHGTLLPNGVIVDMRFQIANDQNLGDQFLPIRFVTYDCGDNGFSDTTGNDLYVDIRIFDAEDMLMWDETDDVNFPESSRPFGMGTADDCFGEGKVDPIRCVEFYDGGICILHPDSIDARGDINLNGVAYEIADAVVFSNYFIYGLRVFTVNLPGQVAASDVNADGATLTVADLVMLIRVIIGDADPVPKLTPHAEALSIDTDMDEHAFSLSTQSAGDIGAGLFVFDLEGDITIDTPRLGDDAAGMELLVGEHDGRLRVLIWDLGSDRIESGHRQILTIPYSGTGRLHLVETDVVDYQGQAYHVQAKGSQLPDDFALDQNYPNPFNPTTTIGFALPLAADWRLTVYNINGELVKEFEGTSNAGQHQVVWNGTNLGGSSVASGIYFYRLDADGFSATRKMVLLK